MTLIVVQDQLSSVIHVLVEARAETVRQHTALLLDAALLDDAQATPEAGRELWLAESNTSAQVDRLMAGK